MIKHASSMLNLSLKFLKNLPQLYGKIPVKSLSSSARFEANFVRRHLIKFVQFDKLHERQSRNN